MASPIARLLDHLARQEQSAGHNPMDAASSTQQVAWQHVQDILQEYPDREEGDYIPDLADATADYWMAVAAERIAHEAQ